MILKDFLKQILPPVLIRICRWLTKPKWARGPAFTGIFKNFEDAKGEDAWSGEHWEELSRRKLERAKRGYTKNQVIPENLHTNCYALTTLVVNKLSKLNPCRVLDFGGGTGYVYFLIKAGLINPENVLWDVVDSNNVTSIGEEYREKSDAICFFDELPHNDKKIDIVHINFMLQYVRDYKETLDRLIRYRPKYFVLTRLIAGDISPFVTSQNVGGRATPAVFLNTLDVIEVFLVNSYSLEFKAL